MRTTERRLSLNSSKRLLMAAFKGLIDKKKLNKVGTATLRKEVQRALGTLPPRRRKILILLYGLRGGRKQTKVEVGKIMKLSRTRVSQIEETAIKSLRHPSRSHLLFGMLGGRDADGG